MKATKSEKIYESKNLSSELYHKLKETYETFMRTEKKLNQLSVQEVVSLVMSAISALQFTGVEAFADLYAKEVEKEEVKKVKKVMVSTLISTSHKSLDLAEKKFLDSLKEETG